VPSNEESHDSRRSGGPDAPPAPDEQARDAALMQRIAQRDGAAMRTLWDQYQSRVARRALRLLRDEDDARAVTIDAFAQLWEAAPHWEPRGRVCAFLLVTVKNAALTRLGQRARFVPLEDDDAPRDERAGPRATRLADEGFVAPSAIEVLAEWREVLVVRAALAELPAAQQRAVELRFFDGLSNEEAARQERVSVNTLKTRLKLAFEKLGRRFASIEARRRRESAERSATRHAAPDPDTAPDAHAEADAEHEADADAEHEAEADAEHEAEADVEHDADAAHDADADDEEPT
jgi:RNA polymerase sigma-70 factor (ECF subfamily)